MVNMQHLMFDIDGTLIQSFEFDEKCYVDAIADVFGETLDCNWHEYPHITDTGILQSFIEKHNRQETLSQTLGLVKASFIKRIEQHIKQHAVVPSNGALDFFNSVNSSANGQFSVSIATGGWRETAELKLASAGFDISNTAISSSNDHYSRTEIMKHSLSLLNISDLKRVTYFGDAQWDKTACEKLGINFIAVGDRVQHHQQISDFSESDKALSFIA